MAADTDIRYVCLSDLHLGAELSLLTNLMPGTPPGSSVVEASQVLVDLMLCLRYLLKGQSSKPTLILLGDILELALADDNVAAMGFERFLELAMPAGGELFERMVYIPGNHDHHLWEIARETQYVSNYLPTTRPGDYLRIPWHTTHIFMDDDPNPRVPSYFLEGLVHRYDRLKDFNINTVYPNYGLWQGRRYVIFHHGHFVESIYLLMTTLKNLIFQDQEKKDRTVDDLEAENFAWIDFLWSTLGRSGDWGKGVEIIYDKTLYEPQFRKLLNDLVPRLAAQFGIPKIAGEVVEPIVDALVEKLVYPERAQTKGVLSLDAETRLHNYVNGPLKIQIYKECDHRHLYYPEELTFVFGHTHKPFETPYKFSPYLPDVVPVYNSGGWVVETGETSPLHGGAAVLLNDNLDVASLRFYNEAGDANDYHVKVGDPPTDAADSEFRRHLQALVKPNEFPWAEFSGKAAKEVEARRQVLRAKIASQG